MTAHAKVYTDLFIDFDDTIYDTRGSAEKALALLFDEMHWHRHFARMEDFTIPYWETNRRLWNQYSLGQIDRDYLIVERFRQPLLHGRGLNPSREECLAVSDRFLDLCSMQPGVVPGARQLLDFLYGKCRMFICSNGFHETQQRKAEASDTARYFNGMILSEDAGCNKPSTAFYRYALQTSNARAETTLMIGDNLVTDIQGAHDTGIDTVYFNRWQTPERGVADYYADRLQDIVTLVENGTIRLGAG